MSSSSVVSCRADVLVVGAGLIGALIALELRKSGLSVTMIDRGVPGQEASSAAAGILGAQVEVSQNSAMFQLFLRSRELHAELAKELVDTTGMDIGFRRSGTLELASTPAALTALHTRFDWQRDASYSVEWLDAMTLRERFAAVSPSMVGGAWFPNDARVDPARLISAVLLAATRSGVEVLSGVSVLGLVREHGRVVGVRTTQGLWTTKHVVLATGAWTGWVEHTGLDSQCVQPARGQILELRTTTPLFSSVLYGEGGYLVPRDDGTVLCGSTLEFVGFRKEVTVAGLAKLTKLATSLVPALESANVQRHWSGFRPYVSDGLPRVGRHDDGVVVAAGHHRNGILLAPITARMVRDLVMHGASDELPVEWNPWRATTQGA